MPSPAPRVPPPLAHARGTQGVKRYEEGAAGRVHGRLSTGAPDRVIRRHAQGEARCSAPEGVGYVRAAGAVEGRGGRKRGEARKCGGGAKRVGAAQQAAGAVELRARQGAAGGVDVRRRGSMHARERAEATGALYLSVGGAIIDIESISIIIDEVGQRDAGRRASVRKGARGQAFVRVDPARGAPGI